MANSPSLEPEFSSQEQNASLKEWLINEKTYKVISIYFTFVIFMNEKHYINIKNITELDTLFKKIGKITSSKYKLLKQEINIIEEDFNILSFHNDIFRDVIN